MDGDMQQGTKKNFYTAPGKKGRAGSTPHTLIGGVDVLFFLPSFLLYSFYFILSVFLFTSF
jgi:hypothetical protein